MNIETFKDLITIQNISDKIHEAQELIKDEQIRIESIVENKNESITLQNELLAKLESLKEIMGKKEKQLFTIETQIKKSNINLNNAKTEQQAKAASKEIETLTPETSTLEDDILNILDKIETLDEELLSLKQYFKNIDNSILEITTEVNDFTKNNENEIKNYEIRYNGFCQSLPKDVLDIFKGVENQFKFKAPVTFVEDDVCKRCHFNVERSMQSNIEKMLLIELCPSCGRILAPISAFK